MKKVKLLVDVSVPGQGIGRRGQVLEMPTDQARDFVHVGHAEEAPDDAEVDEIKEELAAKHRATKPLHGPSETKDSAPAGTLTTASAGKLPPAKAK